ncbi:Poly [ADP-ribose] polymerase [Hordeum vulgare]|nr:Poly [ADP-ribose] polymerase [Hordeum vulgare]
MDFSDDVKQAIPRPVLVFGGVGGARPCPLLRGWREFRRSGAPVSDRKRKRGEDELKDGASSGVEERSDESSDTVESGRVSKAARGAWGRTVRLEETDKFYQVVKKLFLSGIAPRMGGGVAITTIHKVAQGSPSRASRCRDSS